MTPVEFRGDLWRQKTRVPGLSCDVVCVILCLAVLVAFRLVTDRQTDGQTDRQTDGHSIASRGNKKWVTLSFAETKVPDFSLRPN